MSFNEATTESYQSRPALDFGRDIGVVEGFAAEVAGLYFPKVDYYCLDYDSSVDSDEYDEFYEVASKKSWKVAEQMPVTFEWNPTEKTLNQYGIKHERLLEIKISSAVLKGYDITPAAGDIIAIDNSGYLVTDIRKQGYFGASNKNIVYVLFANKAVTRDLPEAVKIIKDKHSY